MAQLTEIPVFSWNVFHGRDAPPDPMLRRAAWRLSAKPIDEGDYVQVNHSLEEQFAGVIAAAQWSVCLLQEAPPAWTETLERTCQAQVFRTLTSRNQFGLITRPIARLRPDLLGSWEGGSNMVLVRLGWRIVPGTGRSLLLNPLRERGLSERRWMSFVRLRSENSSAEEICVANLHATSRGQVHAERELRRAAAAALSWAGETPMVFGGDFNLRPRSSRVFEELEHRFGIGGTADPDSIDHLFARGLEVIRPPTRWPDERRELVVRWKAGKRRIRLSDHAPIEAAFCSSSDAVQVGV